MAVTRSYGKVDRADPGSVDVPKNSRTRGEGAPTKPVLQLATKKDRARKTRKSPEVLVSPSRRPSRTRGRSGSSRV